MENVLFVEPIDAEVVYRAIRELEARLRDVAGRSRGHHYQLLRTWARLHAVPALSADAAVTRHDRHALDWGMRELEGELLSVARACVLLQDGPNRP